MTDEIDTLLQNLEQRRSVLELSMEIANARFVERAAKHLSPASLDELRRNLGRFSGSALPVRVPEIERMHSIRNAVSVKLDHIGEAMKADIERYDHVGAATDLVNDFVADTMSAGMMPAAMAEQLIVAGATLLTMLGKREAATLLLNETARAVMANGQKAH